MFRLGTRPDRKRMSVPPEASTPSCSPLTVLMESGMRQALIRAIDRLPEREKLVLSLCYDQELNLREIGAVLDVTESRVCQIRGQAITRLRNQLRGLL